MTPVFAAFFLGQGGYLFSMPFASIADTASARGYGAWVYPYTDWQRAMDDIKAVRAHSKIALIGYSLGVSTATYLQTLMPCDLLISVAASTLGDNHLVVHKNTKRSVLFYGTDFLSSGAQHDGYDDKIPVTAGFGIPVLSHLSIPASPIVVNGVLGELAKLKGAS